MIESSHKKQKAVAQAKQQAVQQPPLLSPPTKKMTVPREKESSGTR